MSRRNSSSRALFFFPSHAGRAAKNAYFPKKCTLFSPVLVKKSQYRGTPCPKQGLFRGKKPIHAAAPAFCPVFSALRPERRSPSRIRNPPGGAASSLRTLCASPSFPGSEKACSVAPQALLHSARHEKPQGKKLRAAHGVAGLRLPRQSLPESHPLRLTITEKATRKDGFFCRRRAGRARRRKLTG